MNEPGGKTTSSLAMTEKRPHRPGGCVGIFFQLFDWNRRFAKKKLFSKKLLPPARPKQATKKFGGDDKLPKHRLIANENSGGFPNVKKNGASNNGPTQKPAMRPPGLVARLMGLESMPAVQQDKSKKKASSFESGSDKGVKSTSSHSEFNGENPNLEKGGSAKLELRPQKLQKTGPFERQPLSRFAAEALQFKSVLSRSRKHHPKLASPVKSPRMTSRRNASRLIDAAARILEPRLHATNRAKCAITYSSSIHHTPKDEVLIEGKMGQSLDPSKNSNYHVTQAKGQSCKNCGIFLDVDGSRLTLLEQPLPFACSVSNYVNPSFQGLESSKPRPSSPKQEKEKVSDRSQEQSLPLTAQARNDIHSCTEVIANRKPLNSEGQIQWHLTSQHCKSKKTVPSSVCFTHKSHGQNQVSLGRDRVPPRSNLCNLHTKRVSSAANVINETKDFVALNRNRSSRTRSRMPVKVDNCKYDVERKSCNKRDGSLSPVRKRRSVNVNQQGESSVFVSTTIAKQRNLRCDAMNGAGLEAHSVSHTCNRSIMTRGGDSNRTSGNRSCDTVSFTFHSPMKQKTESGVSNDNAQEISILDRSDRKIDSEKAFPLSGDALGALLEQKLEELNSQGEDELSTGDARPKRTTAMILQELISALTAERPMSPSDMVLGPDNKNHLRHSGHPLNRKLTFQAKEKRAGVSFGHLHESDHLSPGSVLEASFSNDSCLSSSVDDSSVPNLHTKLVDCSYDGQLLFDSDAELFDSATSLSKERNGIQLVTNLLDHISKVLYIGFADTGLKGNKLTHAKEVLLNAELIFRNAAPHGPNGYTDSSLSQFLIYELETLARVLRANFGHPIFTKDGNQLKGFLFDCMIEYLDSRYGLYCKSGFTAWSRMPRCMTSDKLISEIVEQIGRWVWWAGMIPDEIIEMEMSHSFGKSKDLEIEEFENVAEIERDLLQILVDEIIVDLCEDRLCCSGISSSL